MLMDEPDSALDFLNRHMVLSVSYTHLTLPTN